jgi:transposase
VGDATKAEALLESQSGDYVIADTAYDADRIRAKISELGAQAVIPSHPCRAQVIPYDQHLYQERYVVEGFINRIKQFRRIGTRYDKTAQSFLAFVVLVAAFVGIR